MYSLTTLPVTGYEIHSDSGAEPEQFGCNAFDKADSRLNELREQFPKNTFSLVALIDA